MLRIQERPRGANPAIWLDGASPQRLRAWVEHLAVPRHATAEARANRWVCGELEREFERLGYRVVLQGAFCNVVALPPEPGPVLTLLAAHYDSVPGCPGADDNASGLAVLLECARAYSRGQPAPNLAFVAFNREEDGLLGSSDFVANGRAALGAALGVTHVLEMVGFRAARSLGRLPLPWAPARLERGDYLGLVTKGSSNDVAERALGAFASPELALITAKTWGPLHRLVPDLGRSDHLPFWEAGLPAALWTDTANFRNPHYHRPTDLPDTLDYDFLSSVATLLCELVSAPPSATAL